MSSPTSLAVTLLEESPLWDGLDGGTLIVSCSGGRDSTAMARAAAELLSRRVFQARFKKPPRLALWHLDHGLRIESPEDRAFVEMLAYQLDAQCIVEHAHLAQHLQEHGGNMEAIAREERYTRLRALINGSSAAAQLEQPVRVVTAHHLGDHAETVLHHLIRGTHLAGLAGIAPTDDNGVFRPWLTLRPELLSDYLAALGQEYREDPSNADLARTRNRLRHEVLPTLLELNPQAREHIARLASTARSAQAWIDEMLAQLRIRHCSKTALLRWLPLISWPDGDIDTFCVNAGWEDPCLLAAYAGRVFQQRGCALTNEEHLQIADWSDAPHAQLKLRGCSGVCLAGRSLLLWRELEELTQPEALQITPNKAERISGLSVQLTEARAEIWQTQRSRARWAWERLGDFPSAFSDLCDEKPPELSWHCFLPAGVELPLSLRCWQEGDRIEVNGGSKTLGDVFTDAKLPRVFRRHWAVLVDGADRPLWVPGVANSQVMYLDKDELPAHHLILRSGDA